MNIALLVPATSHKRSYTCFKETDLYCYLFKSFFTTYSQEHKYTIYLGIDVDDKLYTDKDIQDNIIKFVGIMNNTDVQLSFFDNKHYKGKPCWIWNELFNRAYNDDCDYFILLKYFLLGVQIIGLVIFMI